MVKVLAATLEAQVSVSRTHTVGGKNEVLHTVPWSPNVHHGECAWAHTLTHTPTLTPNSVLLVWHLVIPANFWGQHLL